MNKHGKPFTMKICEVIWIFPNYLWKTGSWKREVSFFAEFIELKCIQKVFRTLSFSKCSYVTALKWIKYMFFLINLHTHYPIMTKQKQVFRHFCICIKNKHKCSDPLIWDFDMRCILFPLIILEMFLQLHWSPPVVHSIDWTWFGKAHIKSHSWQCVSKQKPSHEVEGIVHRASRQDCVDAQIWGRVPKHFCIIEGLQNQCPPSFLNGRSLEPPRHFLELSSRPNWAIRGEGPWSGSWPRTRWSL